MPEMSGRDLADHLVAKRPRLRVLYMSGYTANVIAHHGVLDDAVAFMQKPVLRQELARKIRAILAG